MPGVPIIAGMLPALAVAACLTVPFAQDASPFPSAAPGDVGLDAEALELLADAVEEHVIDGSIVGAELHVIQDRRTVLHRAFGHADRESGRAMETDQVFCVRSMTKPLVGTAIQMLIDEGRLALDTTVASILPTFATPGTDAITIEHLLTHRAGFPFTTLTRSLDAYGSLADVAAEAAATDRLFEPGTDFQYSDAGSDTLGAIVAAVSGVPTEVFVQRRLLNPLGMSDSFPLLTDDHPALARVPSAYSGRAGAWTRHWRAQDGPIFPLFLTSQGLYATTTDYARFLALWMDGGRDLISDAAVARALVPRSPLPTPCGFSNLLPSYGQQWTVYTHPGGDEVEVFGHTGSDGTHAWAWPDRDLIVLLFTQSRGTLVALDFERTLERLLIDGDIAGHRAARHLRSLESADLAPYEGLYWDEDKARAYYAVRAEGPRLTIERPGAFVRNLEPTGTPGHFALEGVGRVLKFEPPEDGASPAFLFPFATRTERQVRHVPRRRPPTLEQVLDDLRAAHGIDAIAEVGTVRATGAIEIRVRRQTGTIEIVYDARRSYVEVNVGGMTERVWITADDRAFIQAADTPVTELEGRAREQAVLDHPLRRLTDWRDDYAAVELLRPIVDEGAARALIRTESHEGAGATRLVDLDSGLLVAEDRFEFIPGMGLLGLSVTYGDFRQVGSLTLPARVHLEYATPLVGEIVTTYDTLEVGIDGEDLLRVPQTR